MSGDMPDWLAGLVSNTDEEEEQPQAAVSPFQVDAARSQPTAPESVDLMADLRSQVAEADAAPLPVAKKKSRSRYVVGGLLPWQLFFLSVLMLLDVAVIGMLFLVMLGRVVLPY